jgi:hypothetical protein
VSGGERFCFIVVIGHFFYTWDSGVVRRRLRLV